MSSSPGYTSEINERHPNFPFALLSPPPPEWELYDIPDKTHLRNRALDLGTFKKLVRHHTWGFDVVIGDRKTKERLLQVLKRIVYNQEASRRPSWHEFVSRNCDAGPRLLRRSYNALQISIRYPDGVPGQPLRLKPGMPEGCVVQAASGDRAAMVNQPSQSENHSVHQGYGGGSGGPGLVNLSMMPGSQAGLSLSSPSPGPMALTSNGGFTIGTPRQGFYQTILGDGSVGRDAGYNPSVGTGGGGFVPPVPAPQGFIQSQSQQQMFPTITPTVSQNTTQQHLSTTVPMQYTNAGEENIHHAARGVVNRELERQSDSFRSAASIYRSSAPQIRLSVSGKIPTFKCDSNGPWYPCRGRGPVSKGISDAVDCTVVAGLLLDIGSTVGDRDNDPSWAMRLSSLENAYLTVLSINWGALTEGHSATRAQEFRNACREHLNTINNTNNNLGAINGDPSFLTLSPASVWKICTSSFRQFQVQYSETFQPCSCQGLQPSRTRSQSTSYITSEALVDRSNGDVDMDSSIRRFFQYERPISCPRCASGDQAVLRRQFGLLPSRLAIRPDPFVIFDSHSSNEITIDYTDSRNLPQKATYRWLGGIYPVATDQQQTMHKVFWNDRLRGEQVDTGAVRVYDAAQVSGMIVGRVLLPTHGERIPTSWWARGTSPLLFYERVATQSTQTVAPTSGDLIWGRLNSADNQQHVFPGQRGQGSQVVKQNGNGNNTQNQQMQSFQALDGAQASTAAFFAPFPGSGTSSLDTNGGASLQHRQVGQQKEDSPPMFSDSQPSSANEWPSSPPLPDMQCSPNSIQPFSDSLSGESQQLDTAMSFALDTRNLDTTQGGTVPFTPEPGPQPQLPVSRPFDQHPISDDFMQLTEGTGQTESLPGVSGFLLDSAPMFPPLPELGPDISTDADGQSGATAQYSSSPFDIAASGNEDVSTPSSIFNRTKIQQSLANNSGFQSETPTASQVSCNNSNDAAAHDVLWGFNLNEASSASSADLAALDDALNCYTAEQHVQQLLPQQQGENQLVGCPNPLSVPEMDTNTVPSAGMGFGGPLANNNSSTALCSKRTAPVSANQSGEIMDGLAGDAARKRAKR